MATYNGEDFIAEQMSSIIPQLDVSDELIISDDSSTDSTLAIVGRFQDPRIKILEGHTFHNPVYNFENAIRSSNGDIIVLSDQDDVWLPNKLSIVRGWFSKMTTGINTLVLDGQVINERGQVLHDSLFDMLRAGGGVIKNLYRNTYMGCCMAFSRNLLQIALPFPHNIRMHDSWLGILSELYGNVEFLPGKTIQYRRHQPNASLGKFALTQQIKWRYFLSSHLARKLIFQPPKRILCKV